ncbi:hypothetical protein, partial [uncultured Oscillibacter sp.]|uniref:hypothetical protein n=1 Tax=uncultured Oscillibacter sp. TaxID=876091 RepID=UPI00261A5C89
ALRPGWDWKSEEFIPQYGPFIGRFLYLCLFAWLLPALISASLKKSGFPCPDFFLPGKMRLGGIVPGEVLQYQGRYDKLYSAGKSLYM